MREWRVIVADDEPAARRGVRLLLAAHPAFTVVGECRNGKEVLAAIGTLAPDVIFLDIQMPELSGLDVIRLHSAARPPAIVFLTAHERYAVPAFDTEAVDYLLKPVSEARFARAIRRLSAHLAVRSKPEAAASLMVSSARGSVMLPLGAVEWIESVDHYARVWSAGRSYLLREPMARLEARVTPHGFLRVHRRALVRVGAVRGLMRTTAESLAVVLQGGATIPVSRRRRAEVGRVLAALVPAAERMR